MEAKALVFDMDGVLIESHFLKQQAFLDLFSSYTDHLPTIAEYNLVSGGIPRVRKFRHICQSILNIPYDAGTAARLCGAYERRMLEVLPGAPLVDGIKAYLRDSQVPMYVSTAAPEAEATSFLDGLGLLPAFVKVFGYPTEKPEALLCVAAEQEISPQAIVFFGDSISDLQAAKTVGTRFIGITAEKNDFVGMVIPTVPGFGDPVKIRELIAHPAAELAHLGLVS